MLPKKRKMEMTRNAMDTLKPVSLGLFVVKYELMLILVETMAATDAHMSIPGTA
jgi:hypothetical protein